jgi:uncharacterized membrane protein YhhN
MTVFIYLAALAAAIDWVAVASSRRKLEGFFKTLTLILLLIWFLTLANAFNAAGQFFLGGLLLSLAGDVALFLRPRAGFAAGLIAFLMAHLAYALTFFALGMAWVPAGLAFLALAGLGSPLLRRIMAGLRCTGRDKLKGPILIYSAALAWMVASAVGFAARAGWHGAAPLAVLGGASFLISDSLLAWNRFVGRVPGGRAAEHVTYHLAQFGLVLSVAQAL